MRVVDEAIGFGQRIRDLRNLHPERPAVTWVGTSGEVVSFTWSELADDVHTVANGLQAMGVAAGHRVVVALGNSPSHFAVTIAVWQVGACVLPLRRDLPDREFDELLRLADPCLVVAENGTAPGPWTSKSPGDLRIAGLSADAASEAIPHPGKSIASGGSTGRPKIIVDPRPWAFVPGEFVASWESIGVRPRLKQLVVGPVYHNSPFVFSAFGLFEDHHVVIMEKFDAPLALELIEKNEISMMITVPTVLSRLARANETVQADLTSLRAVIHTGGPCPRSLKHAWIELVGGDHLYEAFGATEAVGLTTIRGDEWLEHEGSVGRAVGCEIQIRDEDGRLLSVGEVGEIFMRPSSASASFEYVGIDDARRAPDGFVSVGDLGHLDAGGYLFLADRRSNMVVTGGANVYPAEIESVLSEHPRIVDSAVVGLPDEQWGQRLHAFVQMDNGEIDELELGLWLRERLAAYKVPKRFQQVDRLPRDDAGKLRRQTVASWFK